MALESQRYVRPHTAAEAALSAESSAQMAIFEARRDELLAKYPEQCIAVCAGEFFPGRSGAEAMDRAERAHPDRMMFLHVHDPCHVEPYDYLGNNPSRDDPDYEWHQAGRALWAEVDRQMEIFEKGKKDILARYPDQFIAVCAGEFFAGNTELEAVAKAAHVSPDRPFFLHRPSATTPALKADADAQMAIFEARRDELLAKHPNQCIAVCAGDFFASHSAGEAITEAERAHPGRALYLHMNNPAHIITSHDGQYPKAQ